MEDIDLSMKVIVVGNGGVGKTSMIQRFSKNVFSTEYKKTLGVDFLMKKKFVKKVGKEIEYLIWDTAGQEYYDSITKRYYKHSQGAVIVFSATDQDSFNNIKRWKEKVVEECGNEIPIVVVQNKIDLASQAKVTDVQISETIKEMGVKFFKASVKENVMVEDIFDHLASEYFKVVENPISKDIPEIKENQPEDRKVKSSNGLELKLNKNKTLKEGKDKKKKKSFCSI